MSPTFTPGQADAVRQKFIEKVAGRRILDAEIPAAWPDGTVELAALTLDDGSEIRFKPDAQYDLPPDAFVVPPGK